LQITLPPDGHTFECHELTVCSHDYSYSPTLTKVDAGNLGQPVDDIEKEVFNWRNAYKKKYLGQCSYLPLRFCETAIVAVSETTGNIMLNELKALPKFPSNEGAAIVIKREYEADQKGKAIILESRVASVDHYGKSLFAAYEKVWSEGCADDPCFARIHALGPQYTQALMNRQKAAPATDREAVVAAENAQGGWEQKAMAEVAASKRRTVQRFRPRVEPRLRTRVP